MNHRFVWPIVVEVSAVLAAVVAAVDPGPPVAPAVALWFVLVCPGLPYVRLLDLGEPATEVLLAVALSISLQALVGLGLLWASAWTSVRVLGIAIVIALIGAFLETRHVLRMGQPHQVADPANSGPLAVS